MPDGRTGTRGHCSWFQDRRNRPPAGRAELRTGAGRSDDLGTRRGIDRSDALVHPQAGPLGGRIDRHEHLGCAAAVAEMKAAGTQGSVVTLFCDDGRRYAHTYYDDAWVAERGWDLAPHQALLKVFEATGTWPSPDKVLCRPSFARPTAVGNARAPSLHSRYTRCNHVATETNVPCLSAVESRESDGGDGEAGAAIALASSARLVALRTAISAAPLPPGQHDADGGNDQDEAAKPESAHQLVSRATMMINKALRLSKIR